LNSEIEAIHTRMNEADKEYRKVAWELRLAQADCSHRLDADRVCTNCGFRQWPDEYFEVYEPMGIVEWCSSLWHNIAGAWANGKNARSNGRTKA
jgi:hypothetical protein